MRPYQTEKVDRLINLLHTYGSSKLSHGDRGRHSIVMGPRIDISVHLNVLLTESKVPLYTILQHHHRVDVIRCFRHFKHSSVCDRYGVKELQKTKICTMNKRKEIIISFVRCSDLGASLCLFALSGSRRNAHWSCSIY